MTDSEIVKALECCKNLNCSACPKKANLFVTDCDVKLCEEAIDLIKRQQAELKKAKSEVVKEFAEKLKECAFECPITFTLGFGTEWVKEAVSVIEIDNLVKEMVGEM